MSVQHKYWSRVKAHYDKQKDALRQSPANRWAIDPYAWDFEAGIRMTPIEAAIWHDIRAELLVLYPQFPVASHFVDFGNPAARVAVECDGAQWHQDKARDAERQARIEAAGWTVYRITGSDCVQLDRYEDTSIELNAARVLLRSIGQQHGIAQ